MKKILIIIFSWSFILQSFAQAPNKFNYQGIARKSDGVPISDQSLQIRISISNTNALTSYVYRETHIVRTDKFGLYNLQIGGGTAVSGTFKDIPWSSGDKYISVELDPAGGTNFVLMGTTQLLSVPFAMYAANTTSQAVILKLTNVDDSAGYNNNVVDTITNSSEEINIGEGTYDKIKGRYTIPVNGVYEITTTFKVLGTGPDQFLIISLYTMLNNANLDQQFQRIITGSYFYTIQFKSIYSLSKGGELWFRYIPNWSENKPILIPSNMSVVKVG